MAEATEKARQLIYTCLKARRAVVLGFMGPNYCGKSELLKEAKAWLGQRKLPYALVDLEEFAGSRVEELLDSIVAKLSASPSAYGKVRFPRYLLARSVLAMPAPTASPLPDEVLREVRRKVRSGWLRDALRTAADLAPAVRLVPGVSGVPADLIRSAVAAVIGPLLGALPAWLLRPGAGWFAKNSRLGPARSADEALKLLWLSANGGAWAEVESTLVAAFLADLRSSARRGRFPIRFKIAYALLIDNADREIRLPDAERWPGKRLVDLLVQEMTDRDRLTVAATHRGSLLASVGAALDDVPATAAVAVPYADQLKPPPVGTRWWPVRIPDLDTADIRERIRTATGWPEAGCAEAATAVYRYTRGHPGATYLVVEALKSQPVPRAGLDLAKVVDGALRRELLDNLLGVIAIDQALMRSVVTCAAVRDREHVPQLVGHGIAVAHLDRVQDDVLWVPGRAERLVLLPVLRQLLLDDLAVRRASAVDGWRNVLGALAAHAEDAGDLESRLYYLLAMGETETVTRELWDRLAQARSGEGWLRLLKHVTLAPGRFREGHGHDAVKRYSSWAGDGDLRTFAILVVRLWCASDPPVLSAIEATSIATGYRAIAVRFPTVAPELNVEAARWDGGGPAEHRRPAAITPPVAFPRPAVVQLAHWSSRFGAAAVLVVLLGWIIPSPGPGTIGCRLAARYDGRQCDLQVSRVQVGGHTELVGLTGGSVAFRPGAGWASAMKALRTENAYATAGGPGSYVTVAVGGPLSDDEPRHLHRVEGAIAAQHEANHDGIVGDRPRIRLVLANMDSAEDHWKPVAGQLVSMVNGPGHLRAVAGMGLSQAETVDAMNEVRKQYVPTVSDMITASTISAHTYPPFARVAPDTAQQLDVLGGYLNPRLAHHKAMLVAYSKRTDMYTAALNADFQRYLGGPWRAGGSIVAPFGDDPRQEFPQIVRILCGARGIDTVLYAGRAADLPPFLSDLGTRPGCAAGKITVISTSDTTRLLVSTPQNRQAWEALRNKDRPTDLIFTPLDDPAYLATRSEDRPSITRLTGLFQSLGFDPKDLDTGWGIADYDATLTAAQAIRTAAGDAEKIPPPQTVADQLRLMSSPSTAVPGGSGAVRLDQNTGDRYDLHIPVLRFVPGKPGGLPGQPKVLSTGTPPFP